MPYKNIEDQRRASRAHYEANKKIYKERAIAHTQKTRAEIREMIKEAKSAPCTDCGVAYPYYVMQFDHLGDKNFTIGRNGNKSLARVAEEISLCEVVCANCHAERTHRRGYQHPDIRLGESNQDVLF